MEQNQNASLFNLNLDAQNSYTLRSAASWAKVLGVVGMIMGILTLVLGLIGRQSTVNNFSGSRLNGSTLANAGLIGSVLLALIFIISSFFALNAGNKISIGLKTNDQATLNAGFAGARNYFAFWAIMIILMLLLMIIGLLGSLSSTM